MSQTNTELKKLWKIISVQYVLYIHSTAHQYSTDSEKAKQLVRRHHVLFLKNGIFGIYLKM